MTQLLDAFRNFEKALNNYSLTEFKQFFYVIARGSPLDAENCGQTSLPDSLQSLYIRLNCTVNSIFSSEQNESGVSHFLRVLSAEVFFLCFLIRNCYGTKSLLTRKHVH